MKNKYKATPKTYASQTRRNGKVTAQLVGLLARADIHVEEKELKSISTEAQERLASVYHSGGVVGRRWIEGNAQFFPVVDRQVEVIQGHHRALSVGRLHQIRSFDPPINVRAGEELLLGTGRLFIGNTDDPDNMREIGIARAARVDLASGRDRMALVQMDFAGAEARVLHNYNFQSLVSDVLMSSMVERTDEEILRGVGSATGRMSDANSDAAQAFERLTDAVQSATLTLDSLSEAYARASESLFGARMLGRRHLAEKKKKKKKQPVHPDAGKPVVRRRANRTLLGVVVADIRVGSGAIKRTSQLEYVARNQRQRKK